jgi:hypothetical protein
MALFRRPRRFSLWASENRTCDRRLRHLGEQVLASTLPLKAQLHIKHFLAAIVLVCFDVLKLCLKGFLFRWLFCHIFCSVNVSLSI